MILLPSETVVASVVAFVLGQQSVRQFYLNLLGYLGSAVQAVEVVVAVGDSAPLVAVVL
jgi:hypothetical protein